MLVQLIGGGKRDGWLTSFVCCFTVFVHRFIVDESIDSDILLEKERDYIGLVVDIDPSISAISEDFSTAIEQYQEECPDKKQVCYPLK